MEESPPRFERETYLLRQLWTVMVDAEAALGRRMRMHPTDLAAINFLTSLDAPAGPTDLARRLGLSPAAATEVVDRLRAAGHVERHRDLADRRRIRLEPSEDAVSTVMGELQPLIAALDATVASRSQEERAALADFLQQVIDVYAAWTETDTD